ncbi:MAG: enoyl-CoA hydratase/isomerase family protein [Thermodesulfobacteriota bacterium]
MAEGVDLDSKYLVADKADGVLSVRIDRPDRRNALTIEMYHGIKKACVVAERDPEIDLVVITGTGDYFCVGGEMGGQHEGGGALDRFTDGPDLTPFVQLERCPKLVMMRINGMCQGGGLVMTIMSDLSIASDRARFRVPELLRGVADCYLGARLAPRIGVARAKYLLYTAQYFSAQDAYDMGLVSRVVPHDQLDAAVAETIEQVRLTGPAARRALKRDINRNLPPLDLGMFQDSLAGEECREGFSAFVEKRPPRWPKI